MTNVFWTADWPRLLWQWMSVSCWDEGPFLFFRWRLIFFFFIVWLFNQSQWLCNVHISSPTSDRLQDVAQGQKPPGRWGAYICKSASSYPNILWNSPSLFRRCRRSCTQSSFLFFPAKHDEGKIFITGERVHFSRLQIVLSKLLMLQFNITAAVKTFPIVSHLFCTWCVKALNGLTI